MRAPRVQKWKLSNRKGTYRNMKDNGINWKRILACGLIVGFLLDLGEFALNRFVLQASWAETMIGLIKPASLVGAQIAELGICGLLVGIFIIWLYAVLEARYRPGWATACRAGAAAWLCACLVPSAL